MNFPWREIMRVLQPLCALPSSLRAFARGLIVVVRLAAFTCAMAVAAPAWAVLTTTPNGPDHTRYDDDFSSAAAAQIACNAFVSQYGASCRAAGGADTRPNVRWSMYGAGWLQITPGKFIDVNFWYCELPNIKIPGSHYCMETSKETTSDPKNNGQTCPCLGNPINPAWDPLESTCRHASLSIL